MTEPSGDFRQRAHALIDRLPHNATWNDVVCQASARRDLQEEDANDVSGRVAEEVLREYELRFRCPTPYAILVSRLRPVFRIHRHASSLSSTWRLSRSWFAD
jgi:hypothetical protein